LDNQEISHSGTNYNNDTGQVDPTQSYDDFVPFGGWTTPSLKQVGGNVTVPLCGNQDNIVKATVQI